jgi:uncharacterized repeat protein (TIGR03833 family)
MLRYATGGRYYQVKKKKKNGKNIGEVSRISCEEYDKTRGQARQPKVGEKVVIIVKPYHQYNCITGIVERVLTRKKTHTRGHKVKLCNGKVGRTMRILS